MASAAPAKARNARAPKAAPAGPRGPATPASAPRTRGIRVRATQLGYYDHVRRRPGDVFTIRSEQEFASVWMEKVDPRTPERVTTAANALREEHERLRALKEQGSPIVGPDDVPDDLDEGTDNPLGAE